MKSLLLIFLSTSLIPFAANVYGQVDAAKQVEAERIDTELSTEEKKKIDEFQKQQAEAQKKANAEKSNTKPPKKVFKPTEEISEDLPVPFPVDI